jgi:hypothetical protein
MLQIAESERLERCAACMNEGTQIIRFCPV